jgi:hypothetical protein
MHPSYQEAGERRLIITLYVALAHGNTYHFINNEFVLVSKSFCLNGTTQLPFKGNASRSQLLRRQRSGGSQFKASPVKKLARPF